MRASEVKKNNVGSYNTYYTYYFNINDMVFNNITYQHVIEGHLLALNKIK